MYSVDDPPDATPDAVEGLLWALAESVQTGDWDLTEQLQGTIYALKGSKGGPRKGLGKGKSGKGGAAPAKAPEFNGACRHCNIWGHKMQDCRKLTAEIAKKGEKGGSKGKASGKGGPKGGKGPIKDPLMEVTGDDDWAGDWAGEIGADTAAADLAEEWALGGAIYSLAADHCDPTGADRAGLTQTLTITGAAASASSRLAKPTYKTFSLTTADHCVRKPRADQPLELDTASASISHLLACTGRGPANTGRGPASASISHLLACTGRGPADTGRGPASASISHLLACTGRGPADSMDLQTYTTTADLCVRKPRVGPGRVQTADSMDLQTYTGKAANLCVCNTAGWARPKKTFYKTVTGGVAAVLAGTHATRTQSTFASRVEAAKRRYGVETKTQNSFAALDSLTDDTEQLLGAVSGDKRGGRVVEAVVDSGAVHSVTPPGVFPGLVSPSPWSTAGRGYRAANGTGIKNLGQLSVKFATTEGDRCSIPFQVAEVEQPLLSVAHLTLAGNRVELGHKGGRVVNLTTGRAIALERRGGVYILKMYLADGVSPAPFRRQGA